MNVVTQRGDGHLLITVTGPAGSGSDADLAAALDEVLAAEHVPLIVVAWRSRVLDLAHAEVLFRAQHAAAARGSALRVAAPGQLGRSVLHFAVPDGVLPLHPSLSSALRAP